MTHHAAVLAFDPGSRGYAVAVSLHTDGARIFRLKFDKAKDHGFHVDDGALAEAFDCFSRSANPLVIVEDVHGRGGWSAQSNFSFGFVTGLIIGAAHARSLTIIAARPQTWQADLGCGEGTRGHQKLRSLARYGQLFPHDPLPRRKDGSHDHNAVDTLLMAYWGAKRVLGREPPSWRFPGG